jgi:hypothetical protein
VNAVSALLNDARSFSEPHFAGVVDFERTASEAEAIDREHNGVKDWFVRVVKRAIDKNVFASQTRLHPVVFLRDVHG